jgi:hypothetical protein
LRALGLSTLKKRLNCTLDIDIAPLSLRCGKRVRAI